MANSFGAMIQAGTTAGKQGFNLATDLIGVGSELTGGLRNFVEDLTAEPTEEEKKAEKENEQRDFLLMQAREMQRQKRELERLGYKSFAELKASLEAFYGVSH